MPKQTRPRRGSLQFYPRKRASKVLPSVNWNSVSPQSKEKGLSGFIAYKVGMASAIVKDNTDKSMTQKKRIVLPVTILETPSMKLFSIRFYKNSKPITEIILSNDRELKRKLKVPKHPQTFDKLPQDYDDIRAIIYSIPKQTSIKKTPDITEVAIHAETKEAKLELLKNLIGKEISFDTFVKDSLLDVRGLTKGKGIQGPVKRFGVALRQHKSEKGVRKVGSIGPWHPAHTTFRTPMAGQMGYFTRVSYNQKLIKSGKIAELDINPKSGFKRYGRINTSYLLINGSVQGPPKRQILITPAFRPTKKQIKKNYEFIELVNKTQ